MNDFIKQLKTWSISSRRVQLTRESISKLGNDSNIAKTYEETTDAFFFDYQVDELKISGFIVIPKINKPKMPTIIFNRGGTGDFGSVRIGTIFTKLARISNMGYVVIGTNYPGNSRSEGKDEHGGITDKKSITKLYDLIKYLSITDDNRIGMYGESRGGIMAYQCLKEVNWIKACITLGAPTSIERSMAIRPEMTEVYKSCFDILDDNEISNRSAIRWSDKLNVNTSLCILHGTGDDRVSPIDSLELATKLQERKHPYSLHMIEGGDHLLTNRSDDLYRYIEEWFKCYL